MLTTPLSKLVVSIRPQTSLLGICFSPYKLEAALTNNQLMAPKKLCLTDDATADGLLRLVEQHQIGGVLLGGSALFRTNGLTQFGARSLVSKIGGDPFGKVGSDTVQLPIGLWHQPGDDAVEMLTRFLESMLSP